MSAKKNRQQHRSAAKKINFELKKVSPLTEHQERVFRNRHRHQVLYGVAGTGKSFLSMYLALDDILNSEIYKQLIIVRSVVSSRNMGFLPGTEKEKAAVYEEPYRAICTELFDRGDAYEYLKAQGIIQFKTTSFVRGITLDNCVLFVDESQNCTAHELNSIITRVGKNCRVIFSGDWRQDDLRQQREQSGMLDFLAIAKAMPEFSTLEFGIDDIVRSEFVKSYILARLRLEDSNLISRL